jgi:hypothetical protein
MMKITTAATLVLAISTASTSALASIVVGPGFGTPCAEGGCPVFGGSVNAIGTNTLDLFQTTAFPGVAINDPTLVFAVPNNPANALPANPVTGAQLHSSATNPSSTPVTVGALGPETLFPSTGPASHDLYGTAGCSLCEPIGFTQLQSADYGLFPSIYNPATNPIDNFSLYNIGLATGANTPFGPNSLIDVDFTSLPVGTFVLAFGFPSLSVTDTPFAQAGVFGLAAAVPEPTSLGPLSSALLCLQWRRQRRARRQAG